jgi:hypothetical protein
LHCVTKRSPICQAFFRDSLIFRKKDGSCGTLSPRGDSRPKNLSAFLGFPAWAEIVCKKQIRRHILADPKHGPGSASRKCHSRFVATIKTKDLVCQEKSDPIYGILGAWGHGVQKDPLMPGRRAKDCRGHREDWRLQKFWAQTKSLCILPSAICTQHSAVLFGRPQ